MGRRRDGKKERWRDVKMEGGKEGEKEINRERD